MTTHSSIVAWRISWTEELGGLSPWGRKELDTTEAMQWLQNDTNRIVSKLCGLTGSVWKALLLHVLLAAAAVICRLDLVPHPKWRTCMLSVGEGVSWELGGDCQLEHLGPVGAFFVCLGLPEAWQLDPRSSNRTKADIAHLLKSALRSCSSDICAASRSSAVVAGPHGKGEVPLLDRCLSICNLPHRNRTDECRRAGLAHPH